MTMTLLTDRPATGDAAAPLRSPLGSGALAALQAVVAALVVIVAPAVAAWVTGGGTGTSWPQVVALAVQAWLLAQHAPLHVAHGVVGLLPMGLTAVPLTACWFAGRRLARVLDPRGDRIAAGFSLAKPSWPPTRAVGSFLAVYCGLAVLLGLAAQAGTPAARAVPWQVLLGSLVVAGLGAGCGAAAYRFAGAGAGVVGLALWLADAVRLPAAPRRWARPALVAVVTQLACGALLLAGALVAGHGRVLLVQRALAPGAVGTAVLLVVQLAYLPDLVVWAAALAAGPGFAIGAGTSFTAAASVPGPLPAVPLLGALPGAGPLPAAALAVFAAPALAGVLAGVVIARRGGLSRLAALGDVLGSACLAGVGLGFVSWLATGPVGPGRLAHTGVSVLACALVFAAEVAAGALVAVGVASGAPPLRRRLAVRAGGGAGRRRAPRRRP